MEHLSSTQLENKKTLLSCIDVEIAAADIYKSFAAMFPEDGAFWLKLAREEEDHARLYLAGDILKLTGELSGVKLPLPVFVAKTLAFTEQVREAIRSRPVTLKEALDISLTLERTVTESIVFELPEIEDPVIANLRKIIDDTESHLERIEKFRIEKGFSREI